MKTPTNKVELMQALKSERQSWEELLNEVGSDRMETSGVIGEWSIKDILAHLTAWEERLVAWLEAIGHGT